MQEKTKEMLQKFEQDYEIYVSATDKLTYWILYARVNREQDEGTHRLHYGKKYVTAPGEQGNVLVMSDPFRSDAYTVESWGPMNTIDDFVKKGLAQILTDKTAADKGQEEGCGTSCG